MYDDFLVINNKTMYIKELKLHLYWKLRSGMITDRTTSWTRYFIILALI